jgi:hypothetical protein
MYTFMKSLKLEDEYDTMLGDRKVGMYCKCNIPFIVLSVVRPLTEIFLEGRSARHQVLLDQRWTQKKVFFV